MDVANLNILVVGLGASGAAAARFLKKRGGHVTVTDSADEKHLGAYLPAIRELGIGTEFGQHRKETFEKADLIVVSPGVPHTIAPLKWAESNGIPVMGEVELASRFIQEPMIAVTGTNGKTTTSMLIGDMLEQSGRKVFSGGNIGTPLIDYVDGGEKADILVVEVSSFQLDTIRDFRPQVALLLNITEDHLDRYPDFAAYVEAKARIFKNQRQGDTAILNADDSVVLSLCETITSRKGFFRHRRDDAIEIPMGAGIATIDDVHITIDGYGGERADIDLSDMGFFGRHNLENAAAAGLASLAAGGTVAGVTAALNGFSGLSHRLEYVDSIRDVAYFNDSKATNVDAVARALDAVNRPVVLIMGGRNKGNDFRLLEESIAKHTKRIIAIGEAQAEIRAVLGHLVASDLALSMEDAVEKAYRAASPGDAVLLSPACASFDMFSSYAERGEVFCRVVKQLREAIEAREPGGR